jgi:hypothetical protein
VFDVFLHCVDGKVGQGMMAFNVDLGGSAFGASKMGLFNNKHAWSK